MTPDTASCLALFEKMVLLRQFELAAQKNYKAGRMPGFIHLYIGEEAVAVGACAHLRNDDLITSTHRGHGHALAKGSDPKAVMSELYGKATGVCGGRGGSMHLYDSKVGLFGTNGFVGGGLPATVGIGMSAAVRKTDQLGVAFFGDGATSHGTFHESINFATVQNAPVVFICENNLYATATPLTYATKNTEIASKAAAYGLPGVAVDGNDVLAMWEVMRQAVERARSGGGPTLIEAKTYRVVGHHEGDPLVGVYRSQEELDSWKLKCPILRFRKQLIDTKQATAEQLDEIEKRVTADMAEVITYAESQPEASAQSAHENVWANPLNPAELDYSEKSNTVEMGWLDAVRDGVAEEMRRNKDIVYLGEGIGERGGSFAHTKNLWKEFGAERVIDTPIAELGFLGACVGAAATGCPAVADMMFADFLFDAASQIIHQGGKLRYMSNGQVEVPMIVRAGMGVVKNTGPHHSGCYHPVWAHCPGLIVAVPSNPADAKGLMKTALRAKDPVIFLEHKLLFSSKGPVPTEEHYVPFGQAAIVRPGENLTIVTCGELVRRCQEAAVHLDKEDISCEIVDLRTIVPLDVDTILESVAKTGYVLVVDEGFAMCGLGAEISAAVTEQGWSSLRAPVGRLHPDPSAMPFGPVLETEIVVTVDKIIASARAVMSGTPITPRRAQGSAIKAEVRVYAAPAITSAPEVRAVSPTGTNADTDTVGVPIVIPNQDLTVTEATVVRWLRQIGDAVMKDEVIVEVETDKATVAVECPADGILTAIYAKEKDVVQMKQTLGLVGPSAGIGC